MRLSSELYSCEEFISFYLLERILQIQVVYGSNRQICSGFAQDLLRIFSVCLSQGRMIGLAVTLMSEKQAFFLKTARSCIKRSGLMTSQ